MLRTATPEEREAGLRAAARARRERALMLRKLKAEKITLADVFARVDNAPHDYAWCTRLGLLVRSLPGVGPATGQRILDTTGLPERRRIGALSTRQRSILTTATAAFGQAPQGRQQAS